MTKRAWNLAFSKFKFKVQTNSV